LKESKIYSKRVLNSLENFEGIPREQFQERLTINDGVWIDNLFENLDTTHIRKVYLENHFNPIVIF